MKTQDLTALLRTNPYPGRGIVLGRTADGKKAVAAYFIMGRSENSRNRIFVETPDGIRTQAHDPSKMTDPSLIIYAPVRVFGTSTIVTNGDQTDTVREGLAAGMSFAQALHSRTFEPDGPNYTPRISGLLEHKGNYTLSILKSADGNPDSCRRYFYHYENPLPSFEGEPEQVAIPCDQPGELANLIWNSLNPDNKVSLFVRCIDLAQSTWESVIINKHEEGKK